MNETESYPVKHKPIVLAQITDSHLFSSLDGLHHGHNVFDNLRNVLLSVRNNAQIDYVVFTGDLTQDHTEQSYQNFVDCVHECDITVPIYYLAGNHDEPELLAKYFSVSPFLAGKEISLSHWQVQLVDSKSATPAGYVSEPVLEKLQSAIMPGKHQLLMMHHHPIDVGYFIDKHGLQNKADFWQAINGYNNIKAIACGHVHSAMELTNPVSNLLSKPLNQKLKEPVVLYTCPATSIQFDPNVDGVAALAKGPGYRVFYLYADGQLNTDVVTL
ncbi:3',5'-cyclic-nucleotide phosphodiesterase [Colwellia sp. 75C3]|uniref:metallophosphoesterase n=1 Tax=Colwellia sp. 75C3 TaxID=888425 RepID=UPI000C3415AC|nr:metallophosphoesterase [Colwellia sp. 75C3]PKG83831.1 3',5'-cyclic-nucleotide phosphodiesterase [Colwellia sp. 75C3]